MKVGDLVKVEISDLNMRIELCIVYLIGIITGFDKTGSAYLFHNQQEHNPQFTAWHKDRLEVISENTK